MPNLMCRTMSFMIDIGYTIEDEIRDSHGTFGFVVKKDDRTMVVSAKKYINESNGYGEVSIREDLIDLALKLHCDPVLVIWDGQGVCKKDACFTFDPNGVRKDGYTYKNRMNGGTYINFRDGLLRSLFFAKPVGVQVYC